MERILVVEDDLDICEVIEMYLKSEGYDLLTINNGSDALEEINKKSFDLAILDIMLPEIDGYTLLMELRKKSEIPVLFLSAKDEYHDKVLGLNIGADDYITKPFNPLELVARVKAHLRRSDIRKNKVNDTSGVYEYKDIIVDINECSVRKDGKEVFLTATEYKILSLLIRNPKRIFSKQQIAQQVSGDDFLYDNHRIVVHISNLREKLDFNKSGDKYIVTVKGLGYKIE